MRSLQGCALVLAATVLNAAAAAAAREQTPTVPIGVAGPCRLDGWREDAGSANRALLKPTAALTQSFQSGDWERLESDVEKIRAQFDHPGGCETKITRKDYLLITWVGDTGLGDTALLTAVVRQGAGEGYVTRLPGLSAGGAPKLYQIFVSDEQRDVLASVYLSTREENPLLKQLPEVAERILEPMLTLLSANMSIERAGASKPAAMPAGGWATVSRVDLPYARATVKVEMKAALAPTEAGLRNASERLKSTLTLLDVPHSDGAKKLADDFDRVVAEQASRCIEAKSPASCLSILDPEFARKYDGGCTGCPAEEARARRLVDSQFRSLAAKVGTAKLSGSADLRNVPLTRYSFGLMSAISFRRSSTAPRVKIDRGVLADDPLSRQLTMVTFNGAFSPYDAGSFGITEAERHRWFVGAAIAPTFGVGVGYSFLPVRGLGINAGYALLGISAAEGDRQVGEPPASVNDPFKLGAAGTAFLGLSYNFR